MAVDTTTIETARVATSTAIVAAGVSEADRPVVAAACETALWGITPFTELTDYLQDVCKLALPLAQAVVAHLDTTVKPTWEKVWVQLDEQQRHWNKLELVDDFSSWSERLDADVAEAAPELAQQVSVSPLLSELLDGGDRWDVTVLLAWLAQQNKLASTAMEVRELRDGFVAWVRQALNSTTYILPSTTAWSTPLTGLLLQYLLQVRLNWTGQDSALIASVIGQYLAQTTNDHSYATIVFGSEEKNEFEWRPVKVVGSQVTFVD